ncbi:sensor histidine kinase [Cohnella sp. GCM10027633]|uniref:sensor histidine kinase n=1 Tax=unclassified Cohnella TaxID=2636738 RepID=UPI00362CD2D4
MSIRLKLTLWYSGLFAVAFIIFGITVYNVVHHNTMSELRERLKAVAAEVQPSGGFFGEYNLDSTAPGFDATVIGMQLIDYSERQDGIVRGKSRNMIGTRSSELTFPYPEQSDAQERFISKTIGKYTFYIYEKPLPYKGTRDIGGLLQVGANTDKEERFFSQLKGILWLSGGAALLAAFLLGMFLSRKALSPIGRVTAAAQQIQSGSELGLRIPREKADDEVGRLTDTLNGMLSGLERAYKNLEESNVAQRRFVSDASHELRTPLTTIRGNVDLLEKIWAEDKASEDGETPAQERRLTAADKREMTLESIHDIADEARRMSRLVNDLLALARADAGYVVDMESIPLAPLAEEAARRASFLPRRAEWIAGPLDALDGVWVRGNRDYLLQLLFILIENGFKYTPEGTVRLYATLAGQYVGLTVVDTGIGLQAEDIPHIFERFYRADLSRGETAGTGLGLSIAKWIAELHQATIDVQSRPGEGSAFTLWLPVGKGPDRIHG